MSSQQNLSTIISSTSHNYKSGENIKLVFSVKNASDSKIKFCTYHTPFEGILNNILEITGPDNKIKEYQGLMMKRAKPSKNNYIKLKPKTIRSTIFEISTSYDLSEKGTYKINFIGNSSINGLNDSNQLVIEIQ